MKKLFLTYLLGIFLSNYAYAVTRSWDGGGDGHSWEDALNWSGDMVPGAADEANFNGVTVTVDGTASSAIVRLIIKNGADVTLNLNLDIGDGTTNNFAIHFQAGGGNLILGSGFTFNLNPPAGKHATYINNTPGTLTNNATLNIMNGNDGIRLIAGSSFTNNSTISISGSNSDGIDNSGNFTNNGDITIDDANVIGINHKAGSFTNNSTITINNPGATTVDGISCNAPFTNTTTGSITVNKPGDDCIEVLNSSTFTNDGTITVTVEDVASSTNVGIAVGSATNAGTFINTSNNTLNADGGISSTGRPLIVYKMGAFTNSGTTNLSGGNVSRRFVVNAGGTLTNSMCATIKLTTGGKGQVLGALLNEGFMQSTGLGVRTETGGSSTNNGFYDFGGTSGFSENGGGAITDNGVNVKDSPFDATAPGACTHDLSATGTTSMTAYNWDYTGNALGANTPGGILDLSAAGNIFPNSSGPHTITITDAGCSTFNTDFTIQLINVCADAALPITLINFDATQIGTTVEISWQTAREINTNYMAVERSDLGLDFFEIGKVYSQGNTNRPKKYTFVDYNPPKNLAFYRLKSVDIDGTVHYSHIVNVPINNQTEDIEIYPNILYHNQPLQLRLSDTFDGGDFGLYDLNGQLIFRKSHITKGLNTIDLPSYPKGMYIVRVSHISYATHSMIIIR